LWAFCFLVAGVPAPTRRSAVKMVAYKNRSVCCSVSVPAVSQKVCPALQVKKWLY